MKQTEGRFMTKMHRVFAFTSLLLALGLSACGKKSALTLPESTLEQQTPNAIQSANS